MRAGPDASPSAASATGGKPLTIPVYPSGVPRVGPGQPWSAPEPVAALEVTPTQGAGPASSAAAMIDAPVRGLVTSTSLGFSANQANCAWSMAVLVPSQFQAA